MHEDRPSTGTPPALPEVITRYLAAHRAHDTAVAVTAFARDATVVDDGRAHEGAEAIGAWIDRSATAFTYTLRLTGAERTDATHYTAAHRLEGDFPGGTVDLRYRFTLRDGRIARLVIEP